MSNNRTPARVRAIAWRRLREASRAREIAAEATLERESPRLEQLLNEADRDLREAARAFGKAWPVERPQPMQEQPT